MSLSSAVGAAPIFFGGPLVNSWADAAGQIVAFNNSPGGFTLSSMQALVHRIYQMDPTAYWQGDPSGASDTVDERITMGLYAGSLLTGVPLDSLIILNNNLNNFLVEYCTDYVAGVGGAAGTGTWQTLVNVTGNKSADYYFFNGSQIASVNGLRLTMHTTLNSDGATGANAAKKLGNFIPLCSQFQMSVPPSKIVPTIRSSRVAVEMADKTFDTTFFGWSDNPFTPLIDVEFLFEHLNVYSATDKASLDALMLSGQSFVVATEPGDVPRNVYLCIFELASYVPVYQQQWKGGGYKAPFKLLQVGFA